MTKTYRTKVNASHYLTVVPQNLPKSSSIKPFSQMSIIYRTNIAKYYCVVIITSIWHAMIWIIPSITNEVIIVHSPQSWSFPLVPPHWLNWQIILFAQCGGCSPFIFSDCVPASYHCIRWVPLHFGIFPLKPLSVSYIPSGTWGKKIKLLIHK